MARTYPAFSPRRSVAGQRTSSFLESAFHHACLSTHDGASDCLEIAAKTERKKADVQKRPEAFMHVGLLVNGPSGRPGRPSSNHPTRKPDRCRRTPLAIHCRTPRRKGNANLAMAPPDRVSWIAWKPTGRADVGRCLCWPEPACRGCWCGTDWRLLRGDHEDPGRN